MIRWSLSVLMLMLSLSLFGQNQVFKGSAVSKLEYSELNEFLTDYNIYSIDATTLYHFVKKSQTDHVQFDLQLGTQHHFSFSLEENFIQRPGIKAKVLTETGLQYQSPSKIKCYNGVVSGTSSQVSISIDKDFLFGFVETGKEPLWFEPLWHMIPGAPSDQYIFYYSKDYKDTGEHMCGAIEAKHKINNIEKQVKEIQNMPESLLACKEVDIAEATDKGMCSKYGSVTAAQNRVIGVINSCQANYSGSFNDILSLKIVDWFNVACNGTDPWSNTTDSGLLLEEFTNWAPGPFDDHDIGQLWTSRTFQNGVVGIAWLSAVCTSYRYNCISDFTNNAQYIRCTVSHELGHNFSCEHDAPGSPYIMAPAVSSTNTWSNPSISSFNSFVPTLWCLSACTGGNLPEADFFADVTSGCKPLTVHFYDDSQGNPVQWLWTFPGGTPSSSSLQNPTVVYNVPGTYDVTLKVTNSSGSDTYIQTQYITVNDVPVADFSVTTVEGLAVFDNKSVNGDDYYWQFGDGEDSNEESPAHDYSEPGTYTVTLTATNECGTTTVNKQVVIVFKPLANFSSNQSKGCAPMTVNFEDESLFNPTSWKWTFPGGTPSSSTAQNPSVTYNSTGEYNVTLEASNSAGSNTITIEKYITVNAKPVASFTETITGYSVSFTNNSTGGSNQYLWTFGDGDSSTVKNPVHIYANSGNYNVILYVTNPCGTDTVNTTITIVALPKSQFGSDVTSGCAALTVNFQDNSTNNPTFWMWSFPGGVPSASTLQNPTVSYDTPGSYSVSLVAGNSAGSDTLTLTNYITVNPKPTADFTASVDDNVATFSNGSANATSWSWTFGDGTQSGEQNPVHSYKSGGTYDVQLIATNNCGSDTFNLTIDVVFSGTIPTAGFESSVSGGCLPLEVKFTDFSSGSPTEWHWSFPGGDPANSDEQNPLVLYNTAGEYDVTLIALNQFGADTIIKPAFIKVNGVPAVKFTWTYAAGVVSFINQTTGGSNYQWDFGDGTGSTEENPVHSYAVPGEYTVSLTVSNECGSYTFIQKIDTKVAVHEISFIQNLKLYPNPNAGRFAIEITSLRSADVSVKVTDVFGRILYTSDAEILSGTTLKEVNLEGVASGTYLVSVESAEGWIVRKILIH